MVSVKLTENSSIGRFTIMGLDGRTEITRNDSCSISVVRALTALSSENLMFTFEESDREEMMNVPEKILGLAFRELGKDLGSHADLCDLLLPKPVTTSKKKSSKKSSLTE